MDENIIKMERDQSVVEQGEFMFTNQRERTGEELQRITLPDKRLYKTPENEYAPSVTTILNSLPADPMFLQWLADAGKGAEVIRNRAAKEGSQTHEGIEQLLKGEQLDWVDNFGNARYSSLVWRMLLRFQDFYNELKPEVLGSEMFLYSKEHQYAGTTDGLFKVGNEIWLLDYKTSNHLDTLRYYAQLAAYAKALEEQKGIKPDKCGILWLKASTRKKSIAPEKGVYQGEGWQISFVDDIEQSFKVFLLAYEMFKITHPKDLEPNTKEYPVSIKLN